MGIKSGLLKTCKAVLVLAPLRCLPTENCHSRFYGQRFNTQGFPVPMPRLRSPGATGLYVPTPTPTPTMHTPTSPPTPTTPPSSYYERPPAPPTSLAGDRLRANGTLARRNGIMR